MRVWTTKWVRHCISTRFGVAYCRERVRQLLHTLRFRQRRLRSCHLKAKPEEHAACQAELAARLAEWPAEQALLCVDEATGRRHPTLTAPWGLVDDIPEVPPGDDHTKVHVYGAVAPLTGRTPHPISPPLGTGACAKCFRQLLRSSGAKRVVVMHDRGAQHTGPPVEAVLRNAQGRLSLTPQPAYAPELNPEERIWKWMRRVVTHNHWFETMPEQLKAIRDFFYYLAGRKEEVRQLCTIKTPESLLALL